MRSIHPAFLVFVILSLTGCITIEKTDTAQVADHSRQLHEMSSFNVRVLYEFAVIQSQGGSPYQRELPRTTLEMQQGFENAIRKCFENKGFQYANDQTDLRVIYNIDSFRTTYGGILQSEIELRIYGLKGNSQQVIFNTKSSLKVNDRISGDTLTSIVQKTLEELDYFRNP